MLGVIEVESAFRKYAVSRAGARGYMQVMPFWINLIGQPGHNLFHLRTNLAYGCAILRHYLDIENGDYFERSAATTAVSARRSIPTWSCPPGAGAGNTTDRRQALIGGLLERNPRLANWLYGFTPPEPGTVVLVHRRVYIVPRASAGSSAACSGCC